MALEAIDYLQRMEQRLREPADIFSFLDIAIGSSVTQAKVAVLDRPSEQMPLEMEFKRLKVAFAQALSQKFIEVIQSRNEVGVVIIFNSAILCGAQSQLYEVFANVFLESFIEKLDQTLRAQTSRVTSDLIFRTVLEYLQSDANEFAFITVNAPTVFDFMGNSFWPCIAPFLEKCLVCPIGSAPEQKVSYGQWNSFLSACESQYRSKNDVLMIRRSNEFRSIQNKLGLNIYTQLISKEIFEQAESFFTEETSIGSQFRLNVSSCICQSFSSLFSPNVFVIEQSKDFVVIAMKLIASLNEFAVAGQVVLLPSFVHDLRKLQPALIAVISEFLRHTMEPAITSLETTVTQICDIILTQVSERFIRSLSYIENVFGPSVQGRETFTVSAQLINAVKTFKQWMVGDGAIVIDDGFFLLFLQKVLAEFRKRAEDALASTQRSAEIMIKVRKAFDPKMSKDNFAPISHIYVHSRTATCGWRSTSWRSGRRSPRCLNQNSRQCERVDQQIDIKMKWTKISEINSCLSGSLNIFSM
jgi:hypothetical protein